MLNGKIHSAEDTDLLNCLKKGDPDAFKQLYKKYWMDLFDEAFKRLEDPDLAKDVVQEVFTFLWDKGNTLDIKNLPAWLTTIVRNQVFTIWRKQQRFVPLGDILKELDTAAEVTEAQLLRKELVRTYENLINSLPDQQRMIFQMRYKDDLSPDKIATLLGLSQKTVRNHLGRAIAKLKAAFSLLGIILLTNGL